MKVLLCTHHKSDSKLRARSVFSHPICNPPSWVEAQLMLRRESEKDPSLVPFCAGACFSPVLASSPLQRRWDLAGLLAASELLPQALADNPEVWVAPKPPGAGG